MYGNNLINLFPFILLEQRLQAAPPPFNPTDIAGCVLWLDGNDPNGTGIQPADNTLISTWKNKSLLGLVGDAVQPVGANQPVFNTNVVGSLGSVFGITFGGNSIFMEIPWSVAMNGDDVTITLVCQTFDMGPDVGGVPYSTVDQTDPFVSRGYAYQAGDGDPHMWSAYVGDGAGSYNEVVDGVVQFNNCILLAMRISGGEMAFYVNGALIGGVSGYTKNLSGPSHLWKLSSNPGNDCSFLINEITTYNRLLPDGDFIPLQIYLLQRWGIA